MSNTDLSLNVKSIFLKENTASMVMNRGMRASTGKQVLYSGNGYLIKNLLNYLICLLQKERT